MPARVSQLKKVLKPTGIVLDTPTRGSHWRFKFNGISFPVPGGNGLKTQVSDVYIKQLCKTFGLDFKVIKAKL